MRRSIGWRSPRWWPLRWWSSWRGIAAGGRNGEWAGGEAAGVFHRNAEVEVSVVHDVLVPQRSARLSRADHERKRPPDHDRSEAACKPPGARFTDGLEGPK